MHSGRETTGAQRRRREPESGALHQVLREHLATFLVRSNEQDGPGLPRFVTRELERALTCGVLAYSEDIAHAIVALLELDDRAFSPGLEVWATNPR